MLVLDTDILSLIQNSRDAAADRVRDRIRASGLPDAIAVTTLTEQLQGWLARCAKASDLDAYIAACRRLQKAVADLCTRTILPFDDRAAVEFRKLKAAKIRIGTMDLRIASIVLAHDATLITRNLTHFRKVPGLRAEDWTAE